MSDERIANPSSASVRIFAVLKLICVSKTAGGRVCGESADYERSEAEDAIAAARADGWTFRLRCARCPACGRQGNSFPSVGKGYQRAK